MPTVTGWINAFFPYLEAIENGLEERIARAEAAEVGVAVAVAVKRLDKALASLTPTDMARMLAQRGVATEGLEPEVSRKACGHCCGHDSCASSGSPRTWTMTP